jgi:hypothetical protein
MFLVIWSWMRKSSKMHKSVCKCLDSVLTCWITGVVISILTPSDCTLCVTTGVVIAISVSFVFYNTPPTTPCQGECWKCGIGATTEFKECHLKRLLNMNGKKRQSSIWFFHFWLPGCRSPLHQNQMQPIQEHNRQIPYQNQQLICILKILKLHMT